jgi:hypothetical protein
MNGRCWYSISNLRCMVLELCAVQSGSLPQQQSCHYDTLSGTLWSGRMEPWNTLITLRGTISCVTGIRWTSWHYKMGVPRIRQARYRSRARDLFLSEWRYTKLSTSTKGADRLSTREAMEYSFYGWILKRCSCCVTIKLLSPHKGIWVLENWPRCVHISLDENILVI